MPPREKQQAVTKAVPAKEASKTKGRGKKTTAAQDARNEALEDARNEARDLPAAVDTDKTPPPESVPASPRGRDRAGGVIDNALKGRTDCTMTLELNQAKEKTFHPSSTSDVRM